MAASEKLSKTEAAGIFAVLMFTLALAACDASQPARSPARDVPPAAPEAKETVRPPAQPAPAESRTPEDASKRAADPKDPSGALIVEPPKQR